MKIKTNNRIFKFKFLKHTDALTNSNDVRQCELIIEILKDKRIPYEIIHTEYYEKLVANLSFKEVNKIINVIGATDVTIII